MSKIPLNIKELAEPELLALSTKELNLRNSKKMYGQLLGIGAIVVAVVLIGSWRKMEDIIPTLNAQPLTTKAFLVILLIAILILIYSYFDKSVQLQVTSRTLKTKSEVIKWEKVQDGYVNHSEYHKGKVVLTLITGQNKKIAISGLELKPDEIADELSNYWSASRQMKNA